MNEELFERVGPGWRTLAAEFCEQVCAAGLEVEAIGADAGALLVEWRDPDAAVPNSIKRERVAHLRLLARRLNADSQTICEGCGDPGALMTRDDEFYGRQVKTLCPACGYRWAQGGFSQWSEVTGVLDPLDQLIADANDEIDPNDDLDEGRREPTPIRPAPIADGGAVAM